MNCTRRTGLALLAGALIAALPPSAMAQTLDIRFSQAFGLPYVPLMVVREDALVEKELAARGIADATVSWVTLGTSTGQLDALLSRQVDFIGPGVPTLLTVWSKTAGTNQEVRALSALQSMPYTLVTREENIHSVADFTPDNRIAVPGVKTSGHAIVLQMAAAAEWGVDKFDQLDSITVNLAHPDATAALISGSGDITSHFASAPFHYQELATPGIHKVLDSYEVMDGPHTNGVLLTTRAFYDENPEAAEAVLAALETANDMIAADPLRAAEIYKKYSNDASPVEDIAAMISDPQVTYTTTPAQVMRFAEFMALAGTIEKTPQNWTDLFFPLIHDRDGN